MQQRPSASATAQGIKSRRAAQSGTASSSAKQTASPSPRGSPVPAPAGVTATPSSTATSASTVTAKVRTKVTRPAGTTVLAVDGGGSGAQTAAQTAAAVGSSSSTATTTTTAAATAASSSGKPRKMKMVAVNVSEKDLEGAETRIVTRIGADGKPVEKMIIKRKKEKKSDATTTPAAKNNVQQQQQQQEQQQKPSASSSAATSSSLALAAALAEAEAAAAEANVSSEEKPLQSQPLQSTLPSLRIDSSQLPDQNSAQLSSSAWSNPPSATSPPASPSATSKYPLQLPPVAGEADVSFITSPVLSPVLSPMSDSRPMRRGGRGGGGRQAAILNAEQVGSYIKTMVRMSNQAVFPLDEIKAKQSQSSLLKRPSNLSTSFDGTMSDDNSNNNNKGGSGNKSGGLGRILEADSDTNNNNNNDRDNDSDDSFKHDGLSIGVNRDVKKASADIDSDNDSDTRVPYNDEGGNSASDGPTASRHRSKDSESGYISEGGLSLRRPGSKYSKKSSKHQSNSNNNNSNNYNSDRDGGGGARSTRTTRTTKTTATSKSKAISSRTTKSTATTASARTEAGYRSGPEGSIAASLIAKRRGKESKISGERPSTVFGVDGDGEIPPVSATSSGHSRSRSAVTPALFDAAMADLDAELDLIRPITEAPLQVYDELTADSTAFIPDTAALALLDPSAAAHDSSRTVPTAIIPTSHSPSTSTHLSLALPVSDEVPPPQQQQQQPQQSQPGLLALSIGNEMSIDETTIETLRPTTPKLPKYIEPESPPPQIVAPPAEPEKPKAAPVVALLSSIFGGKNKSKQPVDSPPVVASSPVPTPTKSNALTDAEPDSFFGDDLLSSDDDNGINEDTLGLVDAYTTTAATATTTVPPLVQEPTGVSQPLQSQLQQPQQQQPQPQLQQQSVVDNSDVFEVSEIVLPSSVPVESSTSEFLNADRHLQPHQQWSVEIAPEMDTAPTSTFTIDNWITPANETTTTTTNETAIDNEAVIDTWKTTVDEATREVAPITDTAAETVYDEASVRDLQPIEPVTELDTLLPPVTTSTDTFNALVQMISESISVDPETPAAINTPPVVTAEQPVITPETVLSAPFSVSNILTSIAAKTQHELDNDDNDDNVDDDIKVDYDVYTAPEQPEQPEQPTQASASLDIEAESRDEEESEVDDSHSEQIAIAPAAVTLADILASITASVSVDSEIDSHVQPADAADAHVEPAKEDAATEAVDSAIDLPTASLHASEPVSVITEPITTSERALTPSPVESVVAVVAAVSESESISEVVPEAVPEAVPEPDPSSAPLVVQPSQPDDVVSVEPVRPVFSFLPRSETARIATESKAVEPEPVAEPVAEPVVEPVVEPVIEPVIEPVSVSMTVPETTSTALPEPAPEPVPIPVVEPEAEPEPEPEPVPVSEPASAPAPEPEPAPEPAPEPQAPIINDAIHIVPDVPEPFARPASPIVSASVPEVAQLIAEDTIAQITETVRLFSPPSPVLEPVDEVPVHVIATPAVIVQGPAHIEDEPPSSPVTLPAPELAVEPVFEPELVKDVPVLSEAVNLDTAVVQAVSEAVVTLPDESVPVTVTADGAEPVPIEHQPLEIVTVSQPVEEPAFEPAVEPAVDTTRSFNKFIIEPPVAFIEPEPAVQVEVLPPPPPPPPPPPLPSPPLSAVPPLPVLDVAPASVDPPVLPPPPIPAPPDVEVAHEVETVITTPPLPPPPSAAPPATLEFEQTLVAPSLPLPPVVEEHPSQRALPELSWPAHLPPPPLPPPLPPHSVQQHPPVIIESAPPLPPPPFVQTIAEPPQPQLPPPPLPLQLATAVPVETPPQLPPQLPPPPTSPPSRSLRTAHARSHKPATSTSSAAMSDAPPALPPPPPPPPTSPPAVVSEPVQSFKSIPASSHVDTVAASSLPIEAPVSLPPPPPLESRAVQPAAPISPVVESPEPVAEHPPVTVQAAPVLSTPTHPTPILTNVLASATAALAEYDDDDDEEEDDANDDVDEDADDEEYYYYVDEEEEEEDGEEEEEDDEEEDESEYSEPDVGGPSGYADDEDYSDDEDDDFDDFVEVAHSRAIPAATAATAAATNNMDDIDGENDDFDDFDDFAENRAAIPTVTSLDIVQSPPVVQIEDAIIEAVASLSHEVYPDLGLMADDHPTTIEDHGNSALLSTLSTSSNAFGRSVRPIMHNARTPQQQSNGTARHLVNMSLAFYGKIAAERTRKGKRKPLSATSSKTPASAVAANGSLRSRTQQHKRMYSAAALVQPAIPDYAIPIDLAAVRSLCEESRASLNDLDEATLASIAAKMEVLVTEIAQTVVIMRDRRMTLRDDLQNNHQMLAQLSSHPIASTAMKSTSSKDGARTPLNRVSPTGVNASMVEMLMAPRPEYQQQQQQQLLRSSYYSAGTVSPEGSNPSSPRDMASPLGGIPGAPRRRIVVGSSPAAGRATSTSSVTVSNGTMAHISLSAPTATHSTPSNSHTTEEPSISSGSGAGAGASAGEHLSMYQQHYANHHTVSPRSPPAQIIRRSNPVASSVLSPTGAVFNTVSGGVTLVVGLGIGQARSPPPMHRAPLPQFTR